MTAEVHLPGSLSVRLSERLPDAQVIGVDADPLLLGLASAGYADRTRVRFVAADLRERGWTDALHLDRAADVVVSTTALHWLTGDELGAVYDEIAAAMAPAGVFVDGDNFGTTSLRFDRLAEAVRVGRADRVAAVGEEWEQWWHAVDQAPELATLTSARGARPIAHTVPDVPTLEQHARLLRAAGFTEVGTVWQHGDDRVLVALRG